MSSTSIEPGFELKHRIAGAVILIGFAIIVLPMVLGGPGPDLRGSAPEPAQADDPDTKVFVSKITPIGGATPVLEPRRPPSSAPVSVPKPAAVRPTETVAPQKPPTVTPSEPAPAAKAKTPIAAVSKAPSTQKAPAKKAATAKLAAADKAPVARSRVAPEVDRGWIVQVGVFSQSENAKKLSGLLEKRGFKPASGQVKTKTGSATRVWIGPYAQRVEAARMRSRVERAIGEKGLIVAYP